MLKRTALSECFTDYFVSNQLPCPLDPRHGDAAPRVPAGGGGGPPDSLLFLEITLLLFSHIYAVINFTYIL